MAEILPIRRKRQFNQSINLIDNALSLALFCWIFLSRFFTCSSLTDCYILRNRRFWTVCFCDPRNQLISMSLRSSKCSGNPFLVSFEGSVSSTTEIKKLNNQFIHYLINISDLIFLSLSLNSNLKHNWSDEVHQNSEF